MGCTSSKEARHDRRRRFAAAATYARSFSAPLSRPFAGGSSRRKSGPLAGVGNEYHHVVSLTSSTLGYLQLDHADAGSDDEEMMKTTHDSRVGGGGARLAEEVGKAKAWSEMIERRIPKTPNKTPPNEPETINAWELMEGLEDTSPLRPNHLIAAIGVDRSFSFHTSRGYIHAGDSVPSSNLGNGSASPRPGWMQLDPGDPIVADFDPEILSTFRQALEELSPPHPYLLRSPEPEPEKATEVPKRASIVQARIGEFQEKIEARKANGHHADSAKVAPLNLCPPDGERKVVFYFTSLRGVRKTYEDCWAIRVILKGYGVRVDERDVSMHSGFKAELNEILGAGHRAGGGGLPRIFADGYYLGGAEEVRQMHENGELGKALEACELAPSGRGDGMEPCEGCGDVRFVPCDTCSGSCKVYVEEAEEEEEEAVAADTWGFRRCPDCNENGLVRCPLCC